MPSFVPPNLLSTKNQCLTKKTTTSGRNITPYKLTVLSNLTSLLLELALRICQYKKDTIISFLPVVATLKSVEIQNGGWQS